MLVDRVKISIRPHDWESAYGSFPKKWRQNRTLTYHIFDMTDIVEKSQQQGHSVKCLFSIHNYRVKDTFYRVSQENRNQNFVDTHARTMPSVFSRPGDAAAKRTMTNPQLGGVKSL